MTSGSRLARIAAARPMAAVESFGSLSSTTLRSASSGSSRSTAARWARPVTTMTRSRAGDRHEAIPGVAQQGIARAGEVVQKLRRVGARQRPEPRADAARRDDAVEPVEAVRWCRS